MAIVSIGRGVARGTGPATTVHSHGPAVGHCRVRDRTGSFDVASISREKEGQTQDSPTRFAPVQLPLCGVIARNGVSSVCPLFSLTAVPIPANLRIKVPFCDLCSSRLVKARKLAKPLLIAA